MSGFAALAWLESTALSRWIVESLWAFPAILTFHAVGMGFAAGLAAMIDMRILGAARGVPLSALRRFLPILWVGFWVNAASGVLLLIGYPTKALTNPLFYLKLLLILTGMVLLVRIARLLFPTASEVDMPDIERSPRLRRLAVVSLVCWAGAIVAGRLLAYTYTYLTAADASL